MVGVYIHFPFCRQRCYYCDFYSQTDTSLMQQYLFSLENQIEGFSGDNIDTIYIGGGTPSLLTPEQLHRLLDALNRKFRFSGYAEITLEINPESSDYSKLKGYRDSGINRLSVGVQTVNNSTLNAIGRNSSRQQIEQTLTHAAEAGFVNVAADIIIGLPDEGVESIEDSIETIHRYNVKHISAYILKVSEGTKLWDKREGLADDDTTADLYCYAAGLLESYGYLQYEVSNFAYDSYQSRHNLKYWNCDDYFGLGAGAYSSIDNKRYYCEADIHRYLECFTTPSDSWDKGYIYDGTVGWDDFLILQLRTTAGLSLDSLKERFRYTLNDRMSELINRYIEAEYMVKEGNYIRMTRKGLLVSNEILSSLLLAAEQN